MTVSRHPALKVRTASHARASITAGYEISPPVAGLGLAFPIQPLSPTLMLVHDEAIAGVQPAVPATLSPGVISDIDPVRRSLTYHARLTLTRRAQGLDWPGARRDHVRRAGR